MILVVLTVTIELLIVRKKIEYTECGKSTVRSNVGTTQFNNGTVKFKNKKQGTTKCDENKVRCDVGTA